MSVANETMQTESSKAIAPRRSNKKLSSIDEHDNETKRVDLAQALTLRYKHHLSYQQIANTMGVSKQAVFTRLQRFIPFLDDPQAIEEYETHKANLLSSAELRLLHSLVDEKAIKSASLNNRAYAFQQVSNFGRLARGESTTNVDIRSLVMHHSKDLDDAKQALASLESAQETGNVACQTIDPVDNSDK